MNPIYKTTLIFTQVKLTYITNEIITKKMTKY